MFQTRYNSIIGTVIHESDGYFTWEQLFAASNGVQKLVKGGSAAIWDLRKSGSISPDLAFFYAAKSAFQANLVMTNTHRRAFVVADTTEADRIRDMLIKLEPAWPWIVKIEMSEALAWIGEV